MSADEIRMKMARVSHRLSEGYAANGLDAGFDVAPTGAVAAVGRRGWERIDIPAVIVRDAPEDVLLFFLAHETGHVRLGHRRKDFSIRRALFSMMVGNALYLVIVNAPVRWTAFVFVEAWMVIWGLYRFGWRLVNRRREYAADVYAAGLITPAQAIRGLNWRPEGVECNLNRRQRLANFCRLAPIPTRDQRIRHLTVSDRGR